MQNHLHHHAVPGFGLRARHRHRSAHQVVVVVPQVGADPGHPRGGAAEGAGAAQLGRLAARLAAATTQGPHAQTGAHRQRQHTLLDLLMGCERQREEVRQREREMGEGEGRERKGKAGRQKGV